MKNEIQKLLDIKQPRYITESYLSKNNPAIADYIKLHTHFLDTSVSVSTRLYYVVNDLKDYPHCKNCNVELTAAPRHFNVSIEEFTNRFCSTKCSRSYIVNLNNLPDTTKNLSDYLRKIKQDPKSFKNDEEILSLCLTKSGKHPSEFTSPLELLYYIANELSDFQRCLNCNNKTMYMGNGKYHKFCSNACHMTSTQTKNKRKQTCIEKYGVENAAAADEVKIKIQNTLNQKYGAHFMKTAKYRNWIKENNPMNDIKTIEKIRSSRHKNTYSKFTNDKKFKDAQIIPLFSLDEYVGGGSDKLYKWKHLECGTEFESWYDDGIVPLCRVCNKGTMAERLFFDYLTNELNLNVLSRSRKILDSNLELDLYCSDLKLAIELDGMYWHANLDRNAHLHKLELCNKLGIKLIRIFEDEWVYDLDIVKNRLRNICGKNENKIYARKCNIVNLTYKETSEFLTNYHIQGSDKSSIRYGLKYGHNLVAIMTFCKQRLALGKRNVKNNCYELSRFCTIPNTTIVGGASKLLSHFEKTHNPTQILTYADRRWSQGKLYYNLGFKLTHISKPNYWYIKNYHSRRIHRFNYRKNILSRKLDNFDASLSEWQNMQNNGFDRIWDCGNLVFEKNYR